MKIQQTPLDWDQLKSIGKLENMVDDVVVKILSNDALINEVS